VYPLFDMKGRVYYTFTRGPAQFFALEPILATFGVQVVFTGHEHFYERLRPRYGVHPFITGSEPSSIRAPSPAGRRPRPACGPIDEACRRDRRSHRARWRRLSSTYSLVALDTVVVREPVAFCARDRG